MIDPRYARFVLRIEPELTEQQRRDIINAGKTRRSAPTPKGPLTESQKQIKRARARARKAARLAA